MTTQPIDQPIQIADWPAEGVRYEPAVTAPSLQEDAWMALLEYIENCSAMRVLYFCLLKRCFDIIVAGIALVLLAPLLLLIGCVIYLTMGGPVIFCQMRIGRNGRPFKMYKFRSMIPDRRRESAPFTGQDRRQRHKSPADPRVTRFGRLLRKSSIDELPQLFNILRGDMSFIGPRPELPEIVHRYASWQHRRHLIRPGLTGWWQVQGRSDLPMHEHTDLDIYYVANLSFWIDVRILIRTVRIVLFRHGAF
jgi:lipopolysaccharide/colanic/teichoic acid biosynthesis glycosyltransferase